MIEPKLLRPHGVARGKVGRRVWVTAVAATLLALAGCDAGPAPPQSPGSLTAHVNGQTGVFVGGFAR
jgi:hypothetical protein